MRAFLLSLTTCLLLVACGEEAPPPEPDLPPIVGVLEVPISHRNDGTRPSDALTIEINQSEMHLNAHPLMTLERGRLPAAEIAPDGLTKLRAAVHAAPARSRAALTIHAMVGFGTTVRTIQTLVGAGYREISIAVRPLTNGAPPAQVGWLTLSSPQVAEAGSQLLDPATYGGATRPWSDFTSHWREAYDACRDGHYIDCDPVPEATPADGFMQVVLWSRGQGMQARFHRVGAAPPPDPAEAAARRPALIEGVRGGENPNAGEEVPATPRVTATFSFRADEATAEGSKMSILARPICGAGTCQTVIEADEETPIMRVVSFLGAMFPNGSSPPQVIFRLSR